MLIHIDLSNSKIFYVLLIIFAYVGNAKAQKSDKKFVEYLYNTRQYEHVVTYTNYLISEQSQIVSADSLNYLCGKALFQQQLFAASNKSLQQVGTGFIHFNESRFLIGINYIYNKEPVQAINYLKQIESLTDSSPITALKYFELSGVALLNRNQQDYQLYDTLIRKDYYFFEKERKSLRKTENDIFNRKEKSPLLAGAMTAIIPGAGRFYAGKRGQAVYSFIITSFMALQAIESYRKDGLNSPRFIIYGSLLSVFHAANIWGSALSVKKYNNEFNEAVNYSIQLDLLIPIRSFYK